MVGLGVVGLFGMLPLPALPGDDGIDGVGSFGDDGIEGAFGDVGFDGTAGVPGVWFGVGGVGAGVVGPWPGVGAGVGVGGVGAGVVGELGDPPAVPPPGACAATGAASANKSAIESFGIRMIWGRATTMRVRCGSRLGSRRRQLDRLTDRGEVESLDAAIAPHQEREFRIVEPASERDREP